jgi:hypothetical protein
MEFRDQRSGAIQLLEPRDKESTLRQLENERIFRTEVSATGTVKSFWRFPCFSSGCVIRLVSGSGLNALTVTLTPSGLPLEGPIDVVPGINFYTIAVPVVIENEQQLLFTAPAWGDAIIRVQYIFQPLTI